MTSNSVPHAWRNAVLGDVTREVSERVGKSDEAPRIYGVERETGLTPTPKYVAKDVSRYKKIEPGMFAYNPMRLNIGSLGYCSPKHQSGAVSPDYVVFQCDPLLLDPLYMYYVTQSPQWDEWVRGAGVGSVRVRIYYRELARMQLRVPPVDEQRAIAAVLGALDDKIEQNRRTGRSLEELARTTFKAWFMDFEPVKAKASGKPSFPSMTPAAFASLPDRLTDSPIGPVPQGWEVRKLDDVLLLQRGFDLPKTARTDGPFPVFAASGLNGWHNEAKVDGPGVTTGRSGVLGQVFFADSAFWPLNTSLWVKEYRRSNPWHAYYFLQTVGLERFNAGSAVPTLNRNHLRNIAAVLAPWEILKDFAEFCGKVFELRAHFEAESSRLTSLRDYLLPRLLSGQVHVRSSLPEVNG